MHDRKRSRSRCCLLISSALVIMTQSNIRGQPSIGIEAYLLPSVVPGKRYKRCLRWSRTRLHEVNGVAGQDINHSSLHNVGYDANSIINFYDRRPWEIGLRLNMLGLPLLGKPFARINSVPASASVSLK